jgi:hypothetical protein
VLLVGLHDKITSLRNEESIRTNRQLFNYRLQFDYFTRERYVSRFAVLMNHGFHYINVEFSRRDSEIVISSPIMFFCYTDYITINFEIKARFYYCYENIITLEKQ